MMGLIGPGKRADCHHIQTLRHMNARRQALCLQARAQARGVVRHPETANLHMTAVLARNLPHWRSCWHHGV